MTCAVWWVLKVLQRHTRFVMVTRNGDFWLKLIVLLPRISSQPSTEDRGAIRE